MLRKAFTLIELLVVIAIIAILAAILFPVFAQAKLAAKKTSDLTNQKQFALGILMYENDADDVTPIAFPNNGLSFYTTPFDRVPGNFALRGAFWTNSVYPYIKNYQLDQTVGGVLWNLFNINDATQNPTHYSDGIDYNAYLNTFNNSSIGSPSDVVLTWPGLGNQNVDGYGSAFPLPYFKSYHFPNSTNPPTPYQFANTGPNCVSNLGVWSGFSKYVYNIYGNGFNMSYCDGHAKYVQAASSRSPWAQVDAQGHMLQWNYDIIDGPQNGCFYVAPLAPIRSSSQDK